MDIDKWGWIESSGDEERKVRLERVTKGWGEIYVDGERK